MEYEEFLKNKIIIAENYGIDTTEIEYSNKLFPHQKDIVNFCLLGGRRAIFASFGLGKSMMQLELARQIIAHTGKPFLIVCPLGVKGEFKRDNEKLQTGYEIEYIKDSDTVGILENKIYLTNYERIRKGDVLPDAFGGVSFDEASILRNAGSATSVNVMNTFNKIPFRFVATATPTPNDIIEILNYAMFLGVITRGQAYTRFFKRDSKKADNLLLYENKKEEFWQWVSTWAAFVDKPSDLGYSDEGYALPNIKIIEHCVNDTTEKEILDRDGNIVFFKNTTKSLLEGAREKRESIDIRLDKAVEIATSYGDSTPVILWHHLEREREYLEGKLKGKNVVSVYGGQDNDTKETSIIDFSNNKYDYLLTKPQIAGSGCNLQNSHIQIHCGVNYKFNDFIQSVHRQYRFGQTGCVEVHIIYTQNENHILKALYKKWETHKELVSKMTDLIKQYGLNTNLTRLAMQRKLFEGGKKIEYDNVTLYNNDCVVATDDIAEKSVGLIVTSIPFGDLYEYSENYNDFGHNTGSVEFWKQMDYIIPKMHRVLDSGRVCCVHVKDRIRHGYLNGTNFTTISDFSGETVQAFQKHGFYLIGKITITTDVVSENNATYRLGWTEQTKDGSKMGVGVPEYVLIFRKAPEQQSNSYSDNPVVKSKEDYTKARWQLDAHSYWRSSGDRLLTAQEIKCSSASAIMYLWKERNKSELYDFQEHLKYCEELDEIEKLSSTFMTLPVHSNNENVWSDILRINTLNTMQTVKKKEKHLCPLQLDVIERLVERFSMQGDLVFDPFGGLFSVAYQAIKMGRRAVSIELNSDYFTDGLFYVKTMLSKMEAPTLFDYYKAKTNHELA